jgi:hypothetical protein
LLEDDLIGQMVLIQVAITEGMNKFPDVQIALLGDHVSQQRIRRNIEGHAQEKVSAALIKLAGELAVGHVKLEKAVAWGQRHSAFPDVVSRANGFVRQFCRIPGGDDQAPGVGPGADLFDHVADLVDHVTVGALPATPLFAINRTKVAVLQGPFVPD